MKATLSAIILAKNEEYNIKDCIQSVLFADEILLIDDFSEDNTVRIARNLGARVIQHPLNSDWGQQRRYGIAQVKSDWILFIDADERVSNELANEIRQVIQDTELRSYKLRRFNKFHYNKAAHGVLRHDSVLRLMPKEGATVEGIVHEKFLSPYPQEILKGKLYHYTYDNWQQYFNKFNNYTTAASKRYQKENKKCYFFRDIVLRPLWAFLKVYLLDRGFMDGKLGFILSVNHYFYTMTKYVKLYYLNKSNGKL